MCCHAMRVLRCCVACKRARRNGTRKPSGAYHSAFQRSCIDTVPKPEAQELRSHRLHVAHRAPIRQQLGCVIRPHRRANRRRQKCAESCVVHARDAARYHGLSLQLPCVSDVSVGRHRAAIPGADACATLMSPRCRPSAHRAAVAASKMLQSAGRRNVQPDAEGHVDSARFREHVAYRRLSGLLSDQQHNNLSVQARNCA